MKQIDELDKVPDMTEEPLSDDPEIAQLQAALQRKRKEQQGNINDYLEERKQRQRPVFKAWSRGLYD